jgi:hypothetical protein
MIPLDIIIFIVVFIIELISFYLRSNYANSDTPSVEERELYAQANKIKAESEKYLSPELFRQHVKLSREANAMETRALQLEKERKEKASTMLGKFTAQFVSRRLPVMLGLVWLLDVQGPAMILPYDGWFWPSGRILTIGGKNLPPASISYLGWTFLVHRVTSRLFMKCFG